MAKKFNLIIIFLLLFSCYLSCGCTTTTSTKTGTIDVSSSPQGAEVYLDNQYKGTTPVIITDVSSGEHIIELRSRDFQTWRAKGTVVEGETEKISASLVPISTTTPVTSQTTSTSISTPSLIGVWRNSDSSGYDNRIRFNADGTFVESIYIIDLKETLVFYGTWSAQGGNSYAIHYTATGNYETYIYDPAQNAIYSTKYSSILLTPYQGDVVAASITPVKTQSPTGTSDSLKYSGSGDDTRGFSVTNGGGFLITGSHFGSRNFIVHITDSNGEIEEFVFNEIGSYSGKKIVHLDAGRHYLEVTASGSWTIDISPT